MPSGPVTWWKEHWQLKPGPIPETTSFFTYLYLCLITSNVIHYDAAHHYSGTDAHYVRILSTVNCDLFVASGYCGYPGKLLYFHRRC